MIARQSGPGIFYRKRATHLEQPHSIVFITTEAKSENLKKKEILQERERKM